MLAVAVPHSARATEHRVVVVDITDEIDLGLVAYLKRALADAEDDDVAAVVLEINTPGGRLDAALEMRDAILDADVRTIAFINREAFSAGALIAIAASEIYMTPAAVIGAATPVTGAGETADEKVVSAVRSVFRSTAEHRGRDPLVAEAMVDPAIAIDGLTTRGQLLTMTTSEAQEWGYADGVVADRAALLEAAGLSGAVVDETGIRLAERLVRILTSSAIASLLFSLGSLMILIDLFTAGFGVVGAVGIGMIAAFFWGHFLAGLAGWEGVALVVVGLALLAVEALVVPGFGVAGILGIAAILGGMFISLIGDDIVTDRDLTRAAITVAAAAAILLVGAGVMIWMLPRTSRLRGLVLSAQVGLPDPAPEARARRRWLGAPSLEPPAPLPEAAATQETPNRSMVGVRGRALSDLRPAGFAQVGDERVDVVTRGDVIPEGSLVEIIVDEGYRRVVRLVQEE